MFVIFVDKNNKKRKKLVLSLISIYKPKITTIDAAKRENLKYISKFKFFVNIA